MRDAALRALLHMYATSPRCLARVASARHGAVASAAGAAARRRGGFVSATRSLSSCPDPARRRRLAASLGGSNSLVLPSLRPTDLDHTRTRRRCYSITHAVQTPETIAVLGGGLTGLATAWYLARMLPDGTKITLYEASDRLGGWIDTEKVEVHTQDGRAGTVHFERAARMVKPQAGSGPLPRWDDLLFFEMIRALELEDMVEFSSEDAPVSGYIYYPDHLVALPSLKLKPLTAPLETLKSIGNVLSLLTEPLFRDVIPSLFNFFRTQDSPYTREIFQGKRDMSMGDYFSHRLGKGVVDKIMSAGIHGIYGGDIYNLSMASAPWPDLLMPGGDEPMTHTRVRQVDYELMKDVLLEEGVFDLATEYLDAKAIWFHDGFETLTGALADDLKRNPNVTIKMGEPITSVSYDGGSDRVMISTEKNQTPEPYEKVVSTLYSKTLAGLTNGHLPSLADSSAVTIQLVNLWYPEMFANHPYHAFGYLLPQALSHDQNPECVLGVIFDSDREFPLPTADDPTPDYRTADTLQGTKLTVMLGGHYWSGLPDSFLPDQPTAIEMAKRAVARHLNLSPELSDQAVASSKLCRDCLPQHTVGHSARMRAAHGELSWGFKGRLAVAGGSYTSPGVLPSLRAARDVANQINGTWKMRDAGGNVFGDAEATISVGDTGLNRFAVGMPQYITVERRLLPLRYGSGAWVDHEGNVRPEKGGGALIWEEVVDEKDEKEEKERRR